MVSKRVPQHTVHKSSYNLGPRPSCNNVVEQHSSLVVSYQRKNRCRGSSIPYVPPDIIFSILVYLPADILYNVVRYVCRDWYNIVSSPEFIDAHLQSAERGLLIKPFRSDCVNYVEMENSDPLHLDEVRFSHFKHFYGMSCCNGLVLFFENNARNVVNFVTKEFITLPAPPRSRLTYPYRSIGCTHSKKYKLVEFYSIRNPKHQISLVAGILTLGVDKEWRSLFQLNSGTKIDNFDICEFLSVKPVVSADGILHLVHRNLPLVYNLDLETETFYVCPIPECSKINRTYMGNGRSLCFIDYLGNFSWELWLLKDAEADEWTKQAIIDLGSHEEMLCCSLGPRYFVLVPVAFLRDGEVVVFNVKYDNDPSRNYITYNVKTGDIKTFYLDSSSSTHRMDEVYMYNPHVKSLVFPVAGN